MTRERRSTSYIVVYCSATPPSKDIGAKEIDRKHRALGKLSIGYHFVVRRDGAVEAGRDEACVGSHDPQLDAVSVAVCLVGGVAELGGALEFNFTAAQQASLDMLLAQLHARYPNAERVVPRHFPLQPETK